MPQWNSENLKNLKMEEKYSTVSQRKKMKHLKINKCAVTLFSGILSLFLMATASSCQKDTLNLSNSSTEYGTNVLSMNVDLGDIDLDPEVAIQYAEASTARGIEMTTPKAGEKIPTFSFAQTGKDEEDFPVFIALFGERHQAVCYGKATWKLIKKTDGGTTKYVVKTKYPIEFYQGTAPDTTKFKNNERWMLHAIYAPNATWDATNQVFNWNATKVVKKLYGANEKLTIGTDIDIPFVLGRRITSGSSSSWWEGYPVKAVKSNSWNFNIILPTTKPGEVSHPIPARFKMLGSLMAINLRNNMSPQESKQDLDTDQTILNGLTYRPTYDFQIRGFHIESTQAVTSVTYSFKNIHPVISAPMLSLMRAADKDIPNDAVRYMLQQGASVSETPQSIPTQENPTRIEIPFEQANYADLNRQTTSGKLYFWMTEIDASGKKPDENIGYGTAIWANLYNKTLQIPMGSTFVYNAQQAHKTGTAYSSTATLLEELRLNPLARMGFDYLAGDPTQGARCTFARSTATNSQRPNDKTGDPGAGQPYAYRGSASSVLSNFENMSFKVDYLKDLSNRGDGSHLVLEHGNLYWHVPDRFDLYSVFPYIPSKKMPGFGGLTYKEGTDEYVHAGKIYRATDEQARIDGVRYKNLKSIYYRNQDATYRQQTYALSRNTFYAFRFIGTPMAVAVRYTEIGKWYNPNLGTNYGVPIDDPSDVTTTSINRHSRFRIEMKTIGNVYRFKTMSMEQAEKYLKDVIIKDNFWQDGFDLRPEVISRTIHVNGIWASNQVNDFSITYGGQALFIWTRKRNDQMLSTSLKQPYPGVYQNHRMDNDGLYYHTTSAAEIGTKGGRGYYVLPWLSLYQPEKQ